MKRTNHETCRKMETQDWKLLSLLNSTQVETPMTNHCMTSIKDNHPKKPNFPTPNPRVPFLFSRELTTFYFFYFNKVSLPLLLSSQKIGISAVVQYKEKGYWISSKLKEMLHSQLAFRASQVSICA